MINNIQNFIKTLGNEGCYTLCLIEIAEQKSKTKINIIEEVLKAIEQKYIYFNFDDYNDVKNFTVLSPSKFLEQMTGISWKVCFKEYPYLKKQNEYIVKLWSRISENGKKITHFDMDSFHPIRNSLTIKLGKIESVRVIKCLEE